MLRTILILSLIVCSTCSLAQPLAGVWSGIISRNAGTYNGIESLELYLNQYGKKLEGFSYSYKEDRRFVLFNIKGKRNKKENEIILQEFGSPTYDLPDNFFPCEKKLTLNYKKIGKTQYLIGKWGGNGYGLDTTCFPGEDLLVVLQRIQKPELPVTHYVLKKLTNYIEKKLEKVNLDTTQQIVIADSIFKPEIEVQTKPITLINNTNTNSKDSFPEDRKLEIQKIVSVKDSILTIKFYDNAIVDDDTISVFVNKKLVFTHQRISIKPLELSIKLEYPGQTIEILMQAENLGSIPPNTALAVVETLSRSYEARLSAGLDKSAVLVIVYEPPLSNTSKLQK